MNASGCRAALIVMLIALATVPLDAQQWDPWTEQKPLDPQRGALPVPASAYPADFDQLDYLDFAESLYVQYRQANEVNAGSSTVAYQGQYAYGAALWYLVERRAEAAGQGGLTAKTSAEWMELAMDYIRGESAYLAVNQANSGAAAAHMSVAARTFHLLDSFSELSPADVTSIRDWLAAIEVRQGLYSAFEYGAMNRSFNAAVGEELLIVLDPTESVGAPPTGGRQSYVDAIWNSWWTHGDFTENSDGYGGLSLATLLWWIDTKGNPALLQDPDRIPWIAGRYLHYVTPLGPTAHYGDSVGFAANINHWIYIFEACGAAYQDGRYRWAAHRLHQYVVAHRVEMVQWGNILTSYLNGLLEASLAADYTLAPVVPESGSLVTFRQDVRQRTREERDASPGDFYEVLEEVVADKVILRTGWGESDLFAMVEASTSSGHGHYDTGSVNGFVNDGSVLLVDTPYLIKGTANHNTFQAQPANPAASSFSAWGTCATHAIGVMQSPTLLISFDARAISGSPYLWMSPLWTATGVHAKLNEGWTHHELQIDLDLSPPYPNWNLAICTVESLSSSKVANGIFQIDNLVVSHPNVAFSDDFDGGLSGWNSYIGGVQTTTSGAFSLTTAAVDGAMEVAIDVGRYPEERTESVSVSLFDSAPGVAYARLDMQSYANKPLDVSRHVFMLGELGLWVKDVCTVTATFDGAIGPAWQLGWLYGISGSNWANSAMAAVPSTYIWLEKYLMHLENRSEDLLVIMEDSTGLATLDIADVTSQPCVTDDIVANTTARRLWKRLDGPHAPASTTHFHSLLLPHNPTDDAATLVDNVTWLLDSATQSVFLYEHDEPWRWDLYGINEAGDALVLEAGGFPVLTDAKLFKIVVGLDGVEEYWVKDATYLQVWDRHLFPSGTLTTRYSKGPFNQALNGAFESDISNWSVILAGASLPGAASWETTDTAGGSAGAFRLNFQTGGASANSHNSGAMANHAAVVAHETIRVRFDAKAVSGTPLLSVRRAWGGSSQAIVELTSSWESYMVEIATGFSGSGLIFCPIGANGKAADAQLLLDNVEIIEIANTVVNPAFESDITSWAGYLSGQSTPGMLTRETTDTLWGSAGSLRVNLDTQGAGPLSSNGSGALATHLSLPDYSRIKVSFYAKWIAGSPYLHMQRIWGGSESYNVQLTSSWAYYEAEFNLDYYSTGILFAPVTSLAAKTSSLTVTDGTFLLDNVQIVAVPSLATNPYLFGKLAGWRGMEDGVPSAAPVYWDPAQVRTTHTRGALRGFLTAGAGRTVLNTGLVGDLSSSPIGDIALPQLRLTFHARWVSGATALHVGPLGDPAEGTSLTLTSSWKSFEVLLPAGVTEIVFATVTVGGGTTVADGDFLLDNILISLEE